MPHVHITIEDLEKIDGFYFVNHKQASLKIFTKENQFVGWLDLGALKMLKNTPAGEKIQNNTSQALTDPYVLTALRNLGIVTFEYWRKPCTSGEYVWTTKDSEEFAEYLLYFTKNMLHGYPIEIFKNDASSFVINGEQHYQNIYNFNTEMKEDTMTNSNPSPTVGDLAMQARSSKTETITLALIREQAPDGEWTYPEILTATDQTSLDDGQNWDATKKEALNRWLENRSSKNHQIADLTVRIPYGALDLPFQEITVDGGIE